MSTPDDLGLIAVTVEQGVAVAVLDAPPANVLTRELFRQLRLLCRWVDESDEIRVVVFRSADPDFFIAHYDVGLIEAAIPHLPESDAAEPTLFHAMCERVRTMSTISIAEIAGRVGGGGVEFGAACDMRFGAMSAVLNQPEIALGIIPGGGGTQYLPRLIGQARTLELVVGASDLDAGTAEAWGYFNRILPEHELTEHVDALARRIARFSPAAVASAKRSVRNAETMSVGDGLIEEARLFGDLLRRSGAGEVLRRFLADGGQTREGELRLPQLLERLPVSAPE
ncbi:enoyl-CoA hydratase/isomerase family protein [Rhodococcus sp. T7]|uniref:enoyl-CoA hydratase/isomerase family protein n=1 Tax=Rhodococcus sp. T7 TaxID=627444 RepID=UPI00135A3F5C|nr:enoyl-CoA hydratase/isomerase family protein [Rhodococcus sp. T7]KAF0965651.1 putative enoyl-CoA hydratase echA8 [Rhodococcus sp. T7]